MSSIWKAANGSNIDVAVTNGFAGLTGEARSAAPATS
jgi:hypothetical protein